MGRFGAGSGSRLATPTELAGASPSSVVLVRRRRPWYGRYRPPFAVADPLSLSVWLARTGAGWGLGRLGVVGRWPPPPHRSLSLSALVGGSTRPPPSAASSLLSLQPFVDKSQHLGISLLLDISGVFWVWQLSAKIHVGLLPLLDFPSGYCLIVGNFGHFSENLSLLIVGFSDVVIFLQKAIWVCFLCSISLLGIA